MGRLYRFVANILMMSLRLPAVGRRQDASVKQQRANTSNYEKITILHNFEILFHILDFSEI